MSETMKIGVVGLGDIAQAAYLPNLHAPEKGREVLALCDLAPERLKWASGVVPTAKTTKKLDDLLKDKSVNWVFVLTPLLAHAPITKKALAAGKNVYTEKPMSMKFAEAARLVEQSKREGVCFASAPVMILYPAYEYVRRLALDGAIGRPTLARSSVAHGGPNSFPTATDLGWLMTKEKATSTPPLPDMGIYAFSLLAHIFGPAKKVSAMATLTLKERTFDKVTAPGFKPYTMAVKVKDNVIINLEFAGGVMAAVTANFVCGGYPGERLEIFGTEGFVSMSYRGLKVAIQSNVPPHNKPQGVHELDMTGRDGGEPFAGVNWGPIVADHLQTALEKGVEPLIGRDFSLHVIEIITAAMKAARTGETQKLSTTFRRDKAWGPI
jgi:predicted dehydrogenase